MPMRRFTRTTNALGKKRETLKTAAALHFAYRRFVKFRGTVRMALALAVGVEPNVRTVADLVERVSE